MNEKSILILWRKGGKKGKKDSQMTPKALKLAAEYEEARAKTKKKSAKKNRWAAWS